MSHAGLRVVASIGIVTLASACASRQGDADGSTTVVEYISTSENAIGPAPPDATSGEPYGSEAADGESLTPASGRASPRTGREANCPMQMPDTRLTTLPAMGGTTFIFTTRNVAARDELRRRALALKDAYANGLTPAAGDATGPGAQTILEANVDYLDERDGARVEVRAVHQKDVDELRRRLRRETTAMNDERLCPALEGAASGAEGASSR